MTDNNILVADPTQTRRSDGDKPVALGGLNGEQIASELHGKFYTVNRRGRLFIANVTAVTIPVIAASLISVFSLLNPTGSGVNMELIDLDMAQVAAATVVDAVGLYAQSDAGSLKNATYTTKATVLSGIGAEATQGANKGLFYSALTHAGTPTRIAIVGTYGATTNANAVGPHYDFDGKLILPPGTIVSVAMSTTIATASGLDIQMRWAEWPV